LRIYQNKVIKKKKKDFWSKGIDIAQLYHRLSD